MLSGGPTVHADWERIAAMNILRVVSRIARPGAGTHVRVPDQGSVIWPGRSRGRAPDPEREHSGRCLRTPLAGVRHGCYRPGRRSAGIRSPGDRWIRVIAFCSANDRTESWERRDDNLMSSQR